jgi:glycosyltransferase involved in cell wall biosynthesis
VRVLFFTRDYTAHDHRFLSALAETDHEVHFLRLEKRGAQREDRPLPPGIHQILWEGGDAPVERGSYRQYSRYLNRVTHEVHPDLVHAGSVQTAALITAMCGFQPLVTMSWGYDMLMDAESTAQMRKDTCFTLDHTSVFVCDCQAVADKAVSFGMSPDRIIKFPWGVDLKHFNPEGREKNRNDLEWGEDEFIILSLRAWEPIYDIPTVVRGFIDAVHKQPQLRLVLLGGGSQGNQLRQMLSNAGVMDKVHFGSLIGYTDLPKYYRSSDLYVSASLTDGSSVSLMEALACGTPAALSKIPGNLEWVDQNTGWFFPVGDWQVLSDHLVQSFQQRELVRGKMRDQARVLAEQRADWQQNFQQLLAAYDMAVEKAA